MNSLKAYWNFLLHPNLNYKKEPFPTRLLNFLVVLGIDLFISALLAWLIYGIRHSIAPDVQFHPLPVPHEKHDLLKFGLAVAIVVPLLEEITFRAHLRPGKGNFALSIVGVLYTTGVLTLSLNHILNTFTITIAVAVGILLLGAYFLFQRRIFLSVGRFWRQKYTKVFYCSAILFGFYHIQNYTLTLTFLVLSPILVFPQIFAGLNLGYLRVRFGFGWGFLLHGLHNAIFLLLPFLLFNSEKQGDKLYKNEVVVDYPKNVVAPAKYHLMIENAGEHVYNGSKVGRNGIDFTHATIRHVFESLSGIHFHHVIFEDTTVANRVINLHFADVAQESMEDFTMAKRFVVQQLLEKYNLRAQLFLFLPGIGY